jgi:hypothetical protein
VVAAGAVGVIDAFTPGVEVAASSVWWDGALGSFENLGKRVLSRRGSHERGARGGRVGDLDALTPGVELVAFSVWWDGALGSLENLGKWVFSHRGGHERAGG